MADVVRRIGLSLGADICWPMCFEDLLQRLDLALEVGEDTVRFACDRVSIEPFDLQQEVGYDVVVDRLTHWYHTSREWIKKAVILDDVYVLNNPWAVQSMEKQTTYCAMMRLGLPIPRTRLLPPKEYEPRADLQPTLERYARYFDVGAQGEALGFPVFMKPYDGGGWVGVTKIENAEQMRAAYEMSGRFVMHVQKGVVPFDMFVRGIGIGPQVRVVRYDPGQPLHARYQPDVNFLAAADLQTVRDTTLTINAFFGWDFNSCELLSKDRVWHPIDFANPCPDSQVTSLHCHFPWLVLAKLRWVLFCAATKRRFRPTLDWQPFYDVAAVPDLSLAERLRRYAAIAAEHFDAARFEDFCQEHLAHLPEVALEYFASDRAREAVRRKVEALYPRHEWDEFTERFWQGVQQWRERAIAGEEQIL